tara:strand:+ start:162 stop:362 length:201 start_codon:yes stop_codon:yes gene_type:complete
MNIFRVRYRIVTDEFCGFEAQKKVWYFPFWMEIGTNTYYTIEDAESFIGKHKERKKLKSKVVKTFK